MTQVIDYAFTHPAAADIASGGYVGVMRYLSNGQAPKDLTVAERDALHGAGLQIGLVFETTADRAGQGRDAGARDAMRANQLADALEYPTDRPLRYAVDFQATWGQVADYFDGAAATGGRPVAAYGCYDVIEGAAGAGYGFGWQCAAWSGAVGTFGQGSGGSIGGRRLSVHAVMFQRVEQAFGGAADVNDVLAADWGGWHPTINPSHPSEENDVQITYKTAVVRDAIYLLRYVDNAPDSKQWIPEDPDWYGKVYPINENITDPGFAATLDRLPWYMGNVPPWAQVAPRTNVDDLVAAIKALPGELAAEVGRRLVNG